ncbi:MAG: hypothetical protein ABIJ40_18280 [Bacteroidota bacterium]
MSKKVKIAGIFISVTFFLALITWFDWGDLSWYINDTIIMLRYSMLCFGIYYLIKEYYDYLIDKLVVRAIKYYCYLTIVNVVTVYLDYYHEDEYDILALSVKIILWIFIGLNLLNGFYNYIKKLDELC